MVEDEQFSARRMDRTFLAQLPREVQRWQAQGLITFDQGHAILNGYHFPEAVPDSRNRVVTVLVILGAVLLGLGVILFFAANWQAFPKGFKLGLMLVGVPAIYGIGYWLRYHRNYQRVGTAIILLGAISFGAAVHLVAQTYNIPVNSPNLVLYWFLGVLPLAYLIRSESITVLALALGLAAVGFRGQEWLLDWEYIPFRAFSLYLALGLMLFFLARLQGRFRSTQVYTRAYETFGLVVAFASIYWLSFLGWWDWNEASPSYAETQVSAEFWVIAAIVVAVTVAAFGQTLLDRRNKNLPLGTLPYEGLAALIMLAAAALVVFVPTANDVVYPLLFNLLLLGGIVGLVFLGYFRGREMLINLALIFFCLGVATRYFEYGFELLDRSLVFIGAGIILIVGGFLLERGRRRVLGRLRSQEVDHES